MELKEKIFNEALNESVVHDTVRWLLATQRQGTHSAKTRTEVSGGGIKPWKQKGTGRARAGSIRSPLWRKGGVIFPPKPRDYSYNLPKKVRVLALRVALSELNRSGRVKVVDQFSAVQPKTKEGVKFLKQMEVSGKITLVTGATAPEFERSVRNIAGVRVVQSKDLNVIDVVNSEWVLLDSAAVSQLGARLS